MALKIQAIAPENQVLDEDTIRQTLFAGLERNFTGQKVLILIPDHTRTFPLPMLFPIIVEALHDSKEINFMVALGTHPPLNEDELLELVGITREEKKTRYKNVGLLNHAWENPQALIEIGKLEKEQIQEIAGEFWHPTLGADTPISINRHALEHEHIIILGPTFPHEVVGFSGGAKYLFPGISGAEIINTTHWLGALVTIMKTIGTKQTPMRDMIHAATDYLSTPVTLASMVVVGNEIAAIFVGDHLRAWEAAVEVSSQRHIQWVDKPFKRVLSHAAPIYDELWTAGKAMYKLDPVVADGGELVIYAPHLSKVSDVHGKYIYEIGYHVLDYFLEQWEQFQHIPLGVLAHSTHVRGIGTFENGIEQARIQVTLATQISAEDCEQLALGYMTDVDLSEWQNREDEGIRYVPKAGEKLFKLR